MSGGRKASKDCRAAAALCLQAVANGASLSQQIPLHEGALPERDRPLYRQLCYGVLRQWPRLQGLVSQLIRKPLKERDGDIAMLALIGLYQLSDTRIPDHAAVSSTVAAAQALNKRWAKGLLNGVLRNWQRQAGPLQDNLNEAQQRAHPPWLYTALQQAWPQQLDAIIEANNSHPPLCLRVNRQQGSRDSYLAELRDQGIAASACAFAPEGLRLEQAMPVEQIPGFAEGRVSVQDESAQLSAHLLQVQPGQQLLDACCAPGGKTGHLLELGASPEQLLALDVDPARLSLVEENLERLGLSAALMAGDSSDPAQWWDGRAFDRILLDAPCSATGVIRRNPDIKLHRQPADIDQLAALQRAILDALWPTLAPGGLLLYATCSVLPAENEQQIAAFCERHADAAHQVIDGAWGQARPFGRQLLPTRDGHDGFYYALLRKIP